MRLSHSLGQHYGLTNLLKPRLSHNPQQDLEEKGVIDSGCSRHMTVNMSYLTDFEEIDGGYVAFGGNPKGGKITGIGTKACNNAGKVRMKMVPGKDYILLPLWTADPPLSQSSKSSPNAGFKPLGDNEKKVTEEPRKEGGDPSKEDKRDDQEKDASVNNTNNVNTASDGNNTNIVNVVSSTVNAAGIEVNVVGTKISIELPDDPNMPALEDIVYSDGNKKDKRGIVIQNKARLVTQGYTQEEEIDYDEVFAPVARIEAIRLFLAYASFKYFVVYQVDVKSAFLYGKIEDEVYVCQPLGFEDSDFLDRVYKVEKALYGLHQAPRAWYETLSTYLLDNGLQRGNIDKACLSEGTKMISMGELTFFLGLQVKLKEVGIFMSQDKYVTEILKKFGFTDVKTASTPMETQKPFLKDEDGKEVDVHLYRSMIGSLMYLTSSRPDIYFTCFPDASYQVNLQEIHPFDLVAYTDSDYAGACLDRKSTTGDFLTKALDTRRFQELDLLLLECSIFKVLIMKMATVKAKTVNGEVQLQALVDGKKIIVTEASVRCDLQLDDEEDEAVNEEKDELKELMDFCTKFQQRVLDLENTKTAQAQEITSLKLRVKRLEKNGGLRTHTLKRLYKVGLTARVESSDDELSLGEEDTSKQGRKIYDIDADEDITLENVHDTKMFDVNDLHGEEVFVEKGVPVKEVSTVGKVNTASIATTVGAAATITTEEITLAQALVEIKTLKPKVNVQDKERLTKEKAQQIEEANIVSWDNVQEMIDVDYQMAQQMQVEEQEKLSIKDKSKLFVQLLEARNKHFAAIKEKEKRNKPPNKAQKRNTMFTYLKNMAGYKHNQLKNKSFHDIQKLFDKAMK
ncbi:putative ribonuclease H-like domain-containing protein, partial [Tanacetum coccineum]